MKTLLVVGALVAGATTLFRVNPPPVPPPAPPAPVSVAAAPEPQADPDAGSIKGVVKIKGEIPKRGKIPSGADPKCAALHAKNPLFSESVVADASGNIQWAFVSITEGLGDRKFEAPKTPVLMEQKDCRFDPHVFGVMAGQDVKFKNGDSLMHIVHVKPNNNREFGFSQELPGAEKVKVFGTKEVIRVFCDVHQWMEAWAHVMEHPFFAVSGADGKFTIKNVPPGKYTLQVWHEKYKPVTLSVELKPKEAKTANFELTDKQ